MKNHRKSPAYIFCCCLLLSTAFFGFMNPTKGKRTMFSLPVTLVPQLASRWCWAATTQMVSAFINRHINHQAQVVSQCSIASQLYQAQTKKIASMPCPPRGVVPSQYNLLGTPFYPSQPGYQSSFNMGAYSWADLTQNLIDSTPVIFQWYWNGVVPETDTQYGSHFMVAAGYVTSSIDTSFQGVVVNDPWPVDTGRHHIIPYTEYANIDTFNAWNNSGRYKFTAHGWDYTVSYQGK
jgi:hypothetical protein